MLSDTFPCVKHFMTSKVYTLVFLFVVSFCLNSYAQTLPVGTPFLEDRWRLLQIKGENDISTSFSIRPINVLNSRHKDSTDNPTDSLVATPHKKVNLHSVTLRQQFNSHHPYGWNDGAMIPAKGYQGLLSFGMSSKVGPLHLQLQPELIYARNVAFSTFPLDRNEETTKIYYTTVLNHIDAPEYFGKGSYTKLLPGQSSVRINHKKLSLGVSTENLWWGPGVRSSLLMSNNAPGFPHITFNSLAPLSTPIGTFEWQLISGTLKGSGVVPIDTAKLYNGVKLYKAKRSESRYINGMIATWQPKWTKGLHLGFARMFYLYNSDIPSSVDGYLPVIGTLFKNNTDNEDTKNRDQLLTAFFRLVLPGESAEVYGELGRNDHSADSRDFALEPEHSSAYVIGFRKLFAIKKHADLEVMTEFTSLQVPNTNLVREQNSWYIHHQVRHGYTNQGQVIGAGIGSGGRSQTFGLKWIQDVKEFGLSFERVVRNNDFYYTVFSPTRNFSSHWVDLSVNLNAAWQHKRFIYTANLSRIKSLNYHWWQNDDVKNWHLQLSTSYLF